MRSPTRVALTFSALASLILLPLAVRSMAHADATHPASRAKTAPRHPTNPDSPAQRGAPASACTPLITETLAPEPLRICEVAQVTVTVGISCPDHLPLHVVFVVGKHLGMQDHLDDVKAAARDAVNSLPWGDDTLVGVLSLSLQTKVETDPTNSKSNALSAISRIQLDQLNPFTNYNDWLGDAQNMLQSVREPGQSPLEAIVVYSTGCPTGFDQYCTRQNASASKAKGNGITLVAICNPNAKPFGFPVLGAGHCKALQDVASSGNYHDLAQAALTGRDLTGLYQTGTKLKLEKLTLTEFLAPGFSLVPGSAVPKPQQVVGQKLVFQWLDLARGQAVTLTYQAKPPQTLGRTALRTKDSQVTLHDNLDRENGPIPVPLRPVTITDCAVVVPTATPIPTSTDEPTATSTSLPTATATVIASATPSPTATALPPTPTATATAVPGEVYLPLLLNRGCRKGKVPNEVVLAIDASSSMAELSGGVAKIDAAKQAATRFVEQLELGPDRDRAAIVVFNTDATVAVPLAADLDRLRQAIRGIATATGTRLDRALATSTAELTGASIRPGSTRILVLLTDGRSDGGTGGAAELAAAGAKAMGIQIYVIGLGNDIDRPLLMAIASSPANLLIAPDAAALDGIYAGIAKDLPCPGGSVWGVGGGLE